MRRRGSGPIPTPEDFIEAYCGQHDTELELAESLAEETGLLNDIPEDLRRLFDMDVWCWELRYDYACEDAEPYDDYVFRNI